MMNKFKQGDKVKCNRNLCSGVDVGDVLEVKDDFTTTGGLWYAGEGFVNTKWLNRADRRLFELVPETPMFDMKTMPWYVQVSNEAEFNAVVEFAKSQGLSPKSDVSGNYSDICFGLFGIVAGDGNGHYLRQKSTLDRDEIKLTFKTVVDKVEYPAVESETQKQIRELKETIEKAQQQIIKLEKENS